MSVMNLTSLDHHHLTHHTLSHQKALMTSTSSSLIPQLHPSHPLRAWIPISSSHSSLLIHPSNLNSHSLRSSSTTTTLQPTKPRASSLPRLTIRSSDSQCSSLSKPIPLKITSPTPSSSLSSSRSLYLPSIPVLLEDQVMSSKSSSIPTSQSTPHLPPRQRTLSHHLNPSHRKPSLHFPSQLSHPSPRTGLSPPPRSIHHRNSSSRPWDEESLDSQSESRTPLPPPRVRRSTTTTTTTRRPPSTTPFNPRTNPRSSSVLPPRQSLLPPPPPPRRLHPPEDEPLERSNPRSSLASSSSRYNLSKPIIPIQRTKSRHEPHQPEIRQTRSSSSVLPRPPRSGSMSESNRPPKLVFENLKNSSKKSLPPLSTQIHHPSMDTKLSVQPSSLQPGITLDEHHVMDSKHTLAHQKHSDSNQEKDVLLDAHQQDLIHHLMNLMGREQYLKLINQSELHSLLQQPHLYPSQDQISAGLLQSQVSDSQSTPIDPHSHPTTSVESTVRSATLFAKPSSTPIESQSTSTIHPITPHHTKRTLSHSLGSSFLGKLGFRHKLKHPTPPLPDFTTPDRRPSLSSARPSTSTRPSISSRPSTSARAARAFGSLPNQPPLSYDRPLSQVLGARLELMNKSTCVVTMGSRLHVLPSLPYCVIEEIYRRGQFEISLFLINLSWFLVAERFHEL